MTTDGANRLTALRRLLSQEKLSTQDELREELENQEFSVTQSTISRDLRRLGAVRAVDADGRTVYRLPNEMLPPPPAAARADALITNITHNGSIIVLKTTPGSASLVASHLDHAKPGGILGTIAGDDTIFVAPSSLKSINSCLKAIQASFQ